MLPASAPITAPIPLHLAVRRYFEVALYLLILTAFGTLASTGQLDFPTVVLVGSVLLFRGYLLAKRRTLTIPETWTTALTLGYVAFYLADYFFVSGSFLNATVHLVLFVMVVRLFSARRDRDYYFLAVIGFLMVLASSVLTVDSVFLLAFSGFMLVAVVTFVLMEMRQAASTATVQSKESSDPRAYRRMAFSVGGAAPVLAVLILIGGAAIFFVLPRVNAGFFSAYAPPGEISTGFSDSVRLGSIGEIQQSNSAVMHIQIEANPSSGENLKWRGVTLSLFDGQTWSNPQPKFALPHLPDNSYLLQDLDAAKKVVNTGWRGRTVHYRVLMEPIGTNVFFLAATPRRLQGDYRALAMDAGGTVFDLDPNHPVNVYEASSQVPQPSATELRAGGSYPPQILLNYLQLPRLDPRIPHLAEQITASAENSYDKAVAVENYLRSNFGYTLQLPRVAPKDPIANFLFERKRGHCEYFASTMAVMLRSLHIPARVVNGFRTGEFNDLTSQYVVRGSDAHSWVEVYFPQYGWVSFDPTPGGAGDLGKGMGRLALYLDAAASFWREWVINYDTRHQENLAWQASSSTRQFFDSLRAWGRQRYEAMLDWARNTQGTISGSPVRWSVGGVLATLLLVFVGNARRLWRGWLKRQVAARPASAPRMAATIWYERMVRLIAKRGWRKSAAHTPAEFVVRIDDLGLRRQVAEFTRHYERARFGDSAEDAEQLPVLFAGIAKPSGE